MTDVLSQEHIFYRESSKHSRYWIFVILQAYDKTTQAKDWRQSCNRKPF